MFEKHDVVQRVFQVVDVSHFNVVDLLDLGKDIHAVEVRIVVAHVFGQTELVRFLDFADILFGGRQDSFDRFGRFGDVEHLARIKD